MVTSSSSFSLHGCRLAYRTQGEGPPVVLIQGVAVPGSGWTPQVAALSTRFRCLTFDNRGMGESLPMGAPLTVERMAEDTEALMSHVGFADAHVAGHSMGGLIALALALRAPERVRTLSLLCTFPSGVVAAPPTPRMLWLGARSRIGTRASRRRAFLELISTKDSLRGADTEALAAEYAPLFGRDIADHPAIEMKQLMAMRKFDARPRLGELAAIRTVVVAATHDPIAPPNVGRSMANAIPGATYVELADASHGAPIQHAARINALLVEHFDG